MNDSINSEEESILLNILNSFDDNLKVSSFRRLVTIYINKQEDDSIYIFLESFNYQDNELTNLLINTIYCFLVLDEKADGSFKVWMHRIEKINSNELLIEKLIKSCKYTRIQIKLLILLNILFYYKECNLERIEPFIDLFCNTNRISVERLTAKLIIFNLEKFKAEFPYKHLKKITHKISTTKITSENQHLAKLSKILNDVPYSFNVYFMNLQQENIDRVVYISNPSFLKEIHSELNKKLHEIVTIINSIIQSNDKKIHLVLKHLMDLLEIFPELELIIKEVITLEKLFELMNYKDEEISYLSTIIVNRILISKELNQKR